MQDQPFDGSTQISLFDPDATSRCSVRRRLSRRPISAWARPGRVDASRARMALDGDAGRRTPQQDLYRVLSPAQSSAAVNAAWNVTIRLQREATTARRRARQAVLIAAGGWLCAAALTAGGIFASQRADDNFADAVSQSQRLIDQLNTQRGIAATAARQRDALRADLLTAHASDSDLNSPRSPEGRPSFATLDITK